MYLECHSHFLIDGDKSICKINVGPGLLVTIPSLISRTEAESRKILLLVTVYHPTSPKFDN